MDGADTVAGGPAPGYRLVLGVPILPETGTLAGGATGDYNEYFTTLARNLVNDGEGNAILRLGWEFNGDWYPWSVQSAGDAANFVAFWQQIVTTMRAVPGENFHSCGTPSAGGSTSYAPPGLSRRRLCGLRGTDVYDHFWGSPFTPAAAWANQLSQAWGLDWLAWFAAAHGKPIGIPEWSVDTDTTATAWATTRCSSNTWPPGSLTHNVAFADIFSFDSSGLPERHPRRQFPQVPGGLQGRLRLT